MRRTLARFVLAIAATLVLVLSCYGLARAYLAYEAARAGHMLKELAAVKIGDSEASGASDAGKVWRLPRLAATLHKGR